MKENQSIRNNNRVSASPTQTQLTLFVIDQTLSILNTSGSGSPNMSSNFTCKTKLQTTLIAFTSFQTLHVHHLHYHHSVITPSVFHSMGSIGMYFPPQAFLDISRFLSFINSFLFAIKDNTRLAVDMKLFIHIHIHMHRFSVDIHGYIHIHRLYRCHPLQACALCTVHPNVGLCTEYPQSADGFYQYTIFITAASISIQ